MYEYESKRKNQVNKYWYFKFRPEKTTLRLNRDHGFNERRLPLNLNCLALSVRRHIVDRKERKKLPTFLSDLTKTLTMNSNKYIT